MTNFFKFREQDTRATVGRFGLQTNTLCTGDRYHAQACRSAIFCKHVEQLYSMKDTVRFCQFIDKNIAGFQNLQLVIDCRSCWLIFWQRVCGIPLTDPWSTLRSSVICERSCVLLWMLWRTYLSFWPSIFKCTFKQCFNQVSTFNQVSISSTRVEKVNVLSFKP